MASLLCAFDPSGKGSMPYTEFLANMLDGTRPHSRAALDQKSNRCTSLPPRKDHLLEPYSSQLYGTYKSGRAATSHGPRSRNASQPGSTSGALRPGTAPNASAPISQDVWSSPSAAATSRFSRRAHTPAPSNTWSNMKPPRGCSAFLEGSAAFARKAAGHPEQAAQVMHTQLFLCWSVM